MTYQAVQIARFGGPEALVVTALPGPPVPGPGEVLIKVLAAGTGFTDTFIRRGRYPDVKGPLPLTLGYELVGTVEATGAGVPAALVGERVADLCVTGGYAQYALRPAAGIVAVPDGVDPGQATCIPLAYVTAYQMLTRFRPLPAGATILVIGASGTVGTALLDLARHLGLSAIGTCSGRNVDIVEGLGATAIDYGARDFVTETRRLTGGRGVGAVFDAIGGAHFGRSFACLAPGGMLVGYGMQAMAQGNGGFVGAALSLARLKLWAAASPLLAGRSAAFYSVTARRQRHPADFKADMTTLFGLLADKHIKPVVIDRLPLAQARAVHERIDRGGLGGKIILLPWDE